MDNTKRISTVVILVITLLILLVGSNFYRIVGIFVDKHIEILENGEFSCKFKDFNYLGIQKAYYFHTLNTIIDFNFISGHPEIVDFAQSFDFYNNDLIISFGRRVKTIYHTNEMFRNKYIPYYDLEGEFTENIVYYYLVNKNNEIADALEYPLG